MSAAPKERYNQQLDDNRWKLKAENIRIRDKHECRLCGAKKTQLDVHHIRYIPGREAWDYDDGDLVTLCHKRPEYQDEEVKQYFADVYSDKGKTLAQKFYTLLNNRALYDTDQISGFVLPFHCYSEPNGDVVFTKNKRTMADYDKQGKSIVSETDVENRLNGSSALKSTTTSRGGCLSIIIFAIIVISLISIV